MIFTSPQAELTLPESDLSSVVLSRVNELADKPALVDGPSGRTLSYATLRARVDQMTAGLQQRGFRKGDVFALFCPNVPEYGIAFLGVAAAGGVNTTVNSLYSASDLSHQLKDSGARFLLTIPEFMDRALTASRDSALEEIFVLGEAEGATPFAALLDNDGKPRPVAIEPSRDLVALPYSSGTTGRSKGVMLTHTNLIANMVLTAAVNEDYDDDRLIAVLPFFHIYGMVLILNLALYRGLTLVTLPRFDLEQFLGLVQEHRITFVNLVPPLVLALARHPLVDKFDLSSVRMIGCGAAPLGQDLEQACAERVGCGIYQGYGLTEVAGACHVNLTPVPPNKVGSVGPPLPNTQCKVIDTETGRELGHNEAGEVLVKGPHVMTGYLNNEAATADCLDADGWLRTGDIGYADEEGYFYIVDRVKELIKYKAWQVAPAELEALLLTHPAIADAAVIPSPDEEAGEVPKAFVVLKGDIDAEGIMAFVADNVAPHKKIRKVEIVDAIPKSDSGKILRRVLVEKERREA